MSERIIFALSAGRSCTAYLAAVMATVPDVWAMHEPAPSFAAAQFLDYDRRVCWLKTKKLKVIWGCSQPVYIETSNLISQGFITPLIDDLGVVFDAIVIHRPPRDVALSYWRRGIIPGRTDTYWTLSPAISENGWAEWTDYGCCFWYAKEKQRRMALYADKVREAGGLVVETNAGDIISEAGFMDLLDRLGLPHPHQEKYDLVKNQHINATPEDRRDWLPPGALELAERDVLRSISGTG